MATWARSISASAYTLWVLSMLPILGQLWRALQRALEGDDDALAGDRAFAEPQPVDPAAVELVGADPAGAD